MNHAQTAIQLVTGDRNADYGDPRPEFEKTAKVWSGIIGHRLKSELTPEEVAMMMVGLKLVRETHKHKADNLVDGHGYLLLLDWMTTGIRPVPLVEQGA